MLVEVDSEFRGLSGDSGREIAWEEPGEQSGLHMPARTSRMRH